MLHIDYDTYATKVSKVVNGVTTKVISSGFADGSSGICCDDDNVIWVGDPQGCTLTKIVNNSIFATITLTADLIGINGDATGMQAAILFEGGATEQPPIVLINQAMAGGM